MLKYSFQPRENQSANDVQPETPQAGGRGTTDCHTHLGPLQYTGQPLQAVCETTESRAPRGAEEQMPLRHPPIFSSLRPPPHPDRSVENSGLFHPQLPTTYSNHNPTPSSSARYEDISGGSDSEGDSESDPFRNIPGLSDFNLSGVGVVLPRKRRLREPSEQAQSLWHHARGGDQGQGQWYPVKANRIISSYTGGEEARMFAGHSRPAMFPLDDSANRRDETMQAQQTRLGAAAHALCSAMTMLNACTQRLAQVLPSSGTADEALNYMCHDVSTALGHSLRVLASEHSLLCRDRRNLCLNTMLDTQGRAAIERLPPSTTQLFSGDMEGILQAVKNRREMRSAFRPQRSSLKARSQRSAREHIPSNNEGNDHPSRPQTNQSFRSQPYGAFRRGRGRGARVQRRGSSSFGNQA